MTLVNVDTHVGPDPKTHVSEMGNFMGRSTPSPAACVQKLLKWQFFKIYQNWFHVKSESFKNLHTVKCRKMSTLRIFREIEIVGNTGSKLTWLNDKWCTWRKKWHPRWGTKNGWRWSICVMVAMTPMIPEVSFLVKRYFPIMEHKL